MNPCCKFGPVLISLAIGVVILGSEAAGAEGTANRPNVLLLCIDDLKPALGCYGDTFAKTPSIDRLAARSTRFDRAYCNQAVCSPSRNALLVGLRPQTLGIYDLATNFRASRPNAVTLPQFFRQHGYQTEALGKVFHVGHGNHEDAASWSVPHFAAKTVDYALPENRATTSREEALFGNRLNGAANLPRGAATEMADVADDTYGDGRIATETIRRLEAAAKSGEPFFIAAGFLKPHLPFVAPKKYWDLHDPNRLPQPTTDAAPTGAPSIAKTEFGELRNYADIPDKGPLDEKQRRHLIHGYYAATSYMDAQVGRVLAALDTTGLSANTIVVLWGDHGWHLGDHGMWCKHTNYEQATRIPLLIAMPGKDGRTSSALVETVDLFPTLASLAGLPTPTGLDGKSLVEVLSQPSSTHRDHVIQVYPRGKLLGRAIRTERYRLVEWKAIDAEPATAQLELYDYATDPGETKNLAAELPDVVAKLRELLAKHAGAKPQVTTGARAASSANSNSEKAKTDRNALFEKKDTNRDGKLTREEFLAGQPDPDEAPKRFLKFDVNQDGVLSRDEFVSSGKVAGK